MAISADICQNLQPFNDNGNISKWVKNSWMEWKTLNLQTKQKYLDKILKFSQEPLGQFQPHLAKSILV